jgi:hypothetical protein
MPERQAWLFLEKYAGRKMAGWIRRRRPTRVRRNELRDCGFRGLRWDRGGPARSAGYRNGYDWTVRIAHLIARESKECQDPA